MGIERARLCGESIFRTCGSSEDHQVNCGLFEVSRVRDVGEGEHFVAIGARTDWGDGVVEEIGLGVTDASNSRGEVQVVPVVTLEQCRHVGDMSYRICAETDENM